MAATAAESDVGKNVSQTELARRMSVSTQSVSRYVSGQQ
ncbi:MAG: helix-turn-helix transcriptional regulator, partial [Prevotella sp.]|nr:helix-turn-helix transcriptional regulator [Prevotella sp.]